MERSIVTVTAIAAKDFTLALDGINPKAIKAGDKVEVNVTSRKGMEDAGFIVKNKDDFAATLNDQMVKKDGGEAEGAEENDGWVTSDEDAKKSIYDMTKAELDAHAKAEFGVDLDGRGSLKTLIQQVEVLVAAKAAHEANRTYCQSIGDDTQLLWADAPDWQRESAIMGVKFHIANPEAGDAASHNSWLAQKKADGWSYGETKNPEAKVHPCMVPFEDLLPEQQAKDALFRETVHSSLKALSVAA